MQCEDLTAQGQLLLGEVRVGARLRVVHLPFWLRLETVSNQLLLFAI